MPIDLDRDITINGHLFKAGKGVDTQVNEALEDGSTRTTDYADAIKETLASAKQAELDQHTHHGAVPDPANPSEATAQTPTRPLAAPNLAGEASTVASTEVTNVEEVKDPGDASATGKKK